MSDSWVPPTIASIVEGDGEVAALPKLLHRIAAEIGVTNLRTERPNKETVDQAPLASIFDLKAARENSPSFDKSYRDVTRLLAVVS